MEIITLIISVVVQVTLGIGLVVVYNQYQKATKKVHYLEREIEKTHAAEFGLFKPRNL